MREFRVRGHDEDLAVPNSIGAQDLSSPEHTQTVESLRSLLCGESEGNS